MCGVWGAVCTEADYQPINSRRARRDGEPHQGKSAGYVCRTHQLSPLVAQPVPFAAVFAGLRAGGITPTSGLAENGVGHCVRGYGALEVTQDRCRHYAKHASCSFPAGQWISLSRAVLYGCRQAHTRIDQHTLNSFINGI